MNVWHICVVIHSRLTSDGCYHGEGTEIGYWGGGGVVPPPQTFTHAVIPLLPQDLYNPEVTLAQVSLPPEHITMLLNTFESFDLFQKVHTITSSSC